MILTINNSISQLTGFTTEQFRTVRLILSYEKSDSEMYYSGGFTRNALIPLIDRKGFFPTGLVYLLITYLDMEGIQYTVNDLRKQPKINRGMFTLNLPFKPHPFQSKAILEALNHKRGCIVAPTGSGKSVIIAGLIEIHQVKTLIVVPNLYLKQQLTQSLTEFFGSMKNITVENIDSKELQKHTKYDMLIIDESHHSASKTYRDLNKKYWNDIYYRFFLTATPVRNRENEQILLESVSGEVIYELTYQEALEAGTIVPLQAYYVDAPKVEITEHYWKGVYNQLVVNNVDRNDMLSKMIIKYNVDTIPTLCLVKEIKHGEQLTSNGAVLFANGEDKDTKQYIDWFNKGKVKVLVGTMQVLGEGVDTRPAEIVIIAGMGKSKPQFQQAVGRVLRTFPNKTHGTVILIRDKDHKWGVAHFNAQKKILETEYGIKVQKL